MAFFSIPARGDAALQEELNVFLCSHRVLTAHREFVGQGDNSFWALAVEYLEGRSPRPLGEASPLTWRASRPLEGMTRPNKDRVDYKEILSPADFALFAKLRDWRKAAAEKEGIPVYAVLTNEQLAAIATKRPASTTQLREIEGIGDAKAGKYGAAVREMVGHGAKTDGTRAPSGATPRPNGGEAVPPESGNDPVEPNGGSASVRTASP